jgi:hypothetical protein
MRGMTVIIIIAAGNIIMVGVEHVITITTVIVTDFVIGRIVILILSISVVGITVWFTVIVIIIIIIIIIRCIIIVIIIIRTDTIIHIAI